MRRCGWYIFVLILALSLSGGDALAARAKKKAARPQPDRTAAIVVDAATGRVLYARNPDKRLHPASLTKMMTLYLTFAALKAGSLTMDTPLHVSAHAAGAPPTNLALSAGDNITVKNCIQGLVTRSANDAAAVLAEKIGGTESGFAQVMTRTARQLGMKNTTFRNASGLPDDQQISSARDMSILARALYYHFPEYYHYFSLRSFTYNGVTYGTHNHLMERYEGMDGFKTGYIRASGFNLVSSAMKDNRRLIGVVFGGKTAASRDAFMEQLLNRTFAQLDSPTETIVTAANDNDAAFQPVAPDTTEMETETAAAEIPARAAPQAQATPSTAAVKSVTVASPSQTASKNILPKNILIDPHEKTRKITVASGPKSSKNWGIQVGAYRKKTQSSQAINHARKSLPVLLGSAKSEISRVKQNKSLLYRARLTGLDRASAIQACAAYQKLGKSCTTVQAGS